MSGIQLNDASLQNSDISMNKNTSSYLDLSNNDNGLLNKMMFKFKVILIGDIAVGKTAILGRYFENNFTDEYHSSIGVEFKVKSISLDSNTAADLKIWDTCGEEKFRSLTRQYYAGSSGVLIVFDLTNKLSFEHLDTWFNDVIEYGPKDIEIILVGNKSDLINARAVKNEEINHFSQIRKLKYIEVSAKTGNNVVLLFDTITYEMVKKEREKEGLDNTSGNDNLSQQKRANKERISLPERGQAKVNKVSCC